MISECAAGFLRMRSFSNFEKCWCFFTCTLIFTLHHFNIPKLNGFHNLESRWEALRLIFRLPKTRWSCLWSVHILAEKMLALEFHGYFYMLEQPNYLKISPMTLLKKPQQKRSQISLLGKVWRNFESSKIDFLPTANVLLPHIHSVQPAPILHRWVHDLHPILLDRIVLVYASALVVFPTKSTCLRSQSSGYLHNFDWHTQSSTDLFHQYEYVPQTTQCVGYPYLLINQGPVQPIAFFLELHQSLEIHSSNGVGTGSKLCKGSQNWTYRTCCRLTHAEDGRRYQPQSAHSQTISNMESIQWNAEYLMEPNILEVSSFFTIYMNGSLCLCNNILQNSQVCYVCRFWISEDIANKTSPVSRSLINRSCISSQSHDAQWMCNAAIVADWISNWWAQCW